MITERIGNYLHRGAVPTPLSVIRYLSRSKNNEPYVSSTGVHLRVKESRALTYVGESISDLALFSRNGNYATFLQAFSASHHEGLLADMKVLAEDFKEFPKYERPLVDPTSYALHAKRSELYTFDGNKAYARALVHLMAFRQLSRLNAMIGGNAMDLRPAMQRIAEGPADTAYVVDEVKKTGLFSRIWRDGKIKKSSDDFVTYCQKIGPLLKAAPSVPVVEKGRHIDLSDEALWTSADPFSCSLALWSVKGLVEFTPHRRYPEAYVTDINAFYSTHGKDFFLAQVMKVYELEMASLFYTCAMQGETLETNNELLLALDKTHPHFFLSEVTPAVIKRIPRRRVME